MFLSGPGGVGKSHVIKLVHSDTLKLLKLSAAFEPDVIALLTAPTGVAAFNINGTQHSYWDVANTVVFSLLAMTD